MHKLQSVSLKNIRVNDAWFNRYVRLVREVVIPYQWKILNDELSDVETSHCIHNFKIAAGLEKGDFYGAVFQDTDLAKWIEAVSYVLMSEPDPMLEERVDEVIALIGKAQWDDGYINTYYTICAPGLRFTNLREGHELYTAGHFMEAAVAYYKATGKREFLDIMVRFADLICDEFSDEKRPDAYPGHQEVEIGLIKLYEITGNENYLKMAVSFLNRRGQKPYFFEEEMKREGYQAIFPEFQNYDPRYSQSHLPVREQKTAEGHAVRATYMYCAMADAAAATDDAQLLEVCRTIWKNIAARRMYVTGSIGSSGLLERFTTDYDLPNSSNYSETCASIGLALFSRRMAQITGQASYMDVAELALYNTVLAGIALDGKSFFYVNPLEVWPDNCLDRTSREHIKPVRQKWFGVACCPPNAARTLASLGEYAVFTDEHSMYINLYAGMEITFGKDAVVQVSTCFPNDGKVTVFVSGGGDELKRIYFRIPGYVTSYAASRNGTRYEGIPEDGYLRIDIEEDRTQIELDLNFHAQVLRSHPCVRENSGKVAVKRGPVVYCLEETDNGANLPALYLKPDTLSLEYDDSLLGGTTVIHGKGYRINERGWDDTTLYSERSARFDPAELTFVPYPYWCNREKGEMLVWVHEWLG